MFIIDVCLHYLLFFPFSSFFGFLSYMTFFCLYYLFLFFFFFKQKTAYEMRISDWSSDVCSSDLNVGALVLAHHVAAEADVARGYAFERYRERLDQHVVDAELDAAAFEAGVELAAQLQERVEADVDGEVDVRRFLHRLAEAARDRLAHAAELFILVRDAEIGDRASGCRCGGWCRSRGRSRRRGCGGRRSTRRRADRKSTRLNSSH